MTNMEIENGMSCAMQAIKNCAFLKYVAGQEINKNEANLLDSKSGDHQDFAIQSHVVV